VRLRESKSARIKNKKPGADGKPPQEIAEPVKLPDSVLWAAKQPEANPYDLEWEDFIDAIRNNKPYNELERGVASSVVTSMGRMACHTGQAVTYDGFMQVQHEFSPNSDKLTLDGPAPIQANAEGRYPVPLPGVNKDREYGV
jgi:hypothetical protein